MSHHDMHEVRKEWGGSGEWGGGGSEYDDDDDDNDDDNQLQPQNYVRCMKEKIN